MSETTFVFLWATGGAITVLVGFGVGRLGKTITYVLGIGVIGFLIGTSASIFVIVLADCGWLLGSVLVYESLKVAKFLGLIRKFDER